MKRHILILTMLLAATTMGAKKLQTVRYTTMPQMHCAGCEQKIKGNLRFERGIKSIETSLDSQIVTLRYDASKTDTVRLRKAFAKIGYTVRPVRAGEKVARIEGHKCDNM